MHRAIIVGVGGMGQCWTRVVHQAARWEAAAYVDVNEEALAAAAKAYGMPAAQCYTDLKRALAETEADALIDVTPQSARRTVCTAALDRGLHVLSEKPLADTVRHAQAVVDRAASRSRVYMVAQNYRFQPETRTAAAYVQGGKLGDVGYANVRFHKGPHFGGFREAMAYPLVLDMCIHHFDMARCILGADIEAVQALSVKAPWNWNQGDATVMVHLEMSNGVMVNYSGSWVAQGWETGWNADWRFDGSRGALLWEGDALYLSVRPAARRKVALKRLRYVHQEGVLESFRKAIETGVEPETSGRQNLNSLAATHAVVRSARTRARVRVREVLA